MNPLTLRAVMRDVLQACRDAYAQPGAPKIPSRVYMIHGTPTWLGEQLVVWSGGITPTHPFPLGQLKATKSTIVPSAPLTIEVVRECWPKADGTNVRMAMPDPDSYTDAAERAALDAGTIFSHIATLAAAGTLCPNVPGLSTAEDFAISPLVPMGPLGDRVGWRMPLAVKLASSATLGLPDA